LTALIGAPADEDRLSRQELVAMCFLLITAGHETTVNLIANGVLALLNHPTQLETVRDDPALISSAVEEMLRYDGPVNITHPRHSTADIAVDGVVIPCGEIVLIALHSANRDGDRFDGADQFDINRATRGHIAFGHGVHHCLGATLARMEGVIALRRLLHRYDHITLDRTEPLRYHGSLNIRGLATLPVWLHRLEGLEDRAACTGL